MQTIWHDNYYVVHFTYYGLSLLHLLYILWKQNVLKKANAHSFNEFEQRTWSQPNNSGQMEETLYPWLRTSLNNKLIYFRYGDFPQQASFLIWMKLQKSSIQEKNRIVVVGSEKRSILEYLAIQLPLQGSKTPR